MISSPPTSRPPWQGKTRGSQPTQRPVVDPTPAQETSQPAEHEEIMVWFQQYAGAEGKTIEPEGMEKFCEDLGVGT